MFLKDLIIILFLGWFKIFRLRLSLFVLSSIVSVRLATVMPCMVLPRDSGYRGRWQNSSSSYHVSSSRSAERVTPYRKRPRDESWSSPSDRGYSSSRYSRGGRDYSSYGRQSGGGNDPMNLLVGLSQMLRYHISSMLAHFLFRNSEFKVHV